MFNGFNQAVVVDTAGAGSRDATDRRRFLRVAVLAGVGVAGVGALGASAGGAFAGTEQARRDPGVVPLLNFLLTVDYLNAELLLRGVFGSALEAELVGGAGRVGRVSAGRKVGLTGPAGPCLEEIASAQHARVRLLRDRLGPAKAGRPELDLDAGFAAAAGSAGLVARGTRWDVFADEDRFLLGVGLLTDSTANAYRGVVPLLPAGPDLDTGTGLLAAAAAHAAVVRTLLRAAGLRGPAAALAGGHPVAVSRSPAQVLNVLYQSPRSVTAGGFFPWGVNGEIDRSDAQV